MSASEFGGIGFAAGSVRGTRSFDIDKLGRLTGVTHKQVWTPGENVAECRKSESNGWGQISFHLNSSMASYVSNMYIAAANTAPPTYSFGGTVPRPASYAAIQPTPVVADPVVARVAEEAAKPAPEPPHSLDNCTCGFYGYYDGSDDYHERYRVSGVVEGYGEAVIGTRGFRVMKSRILALRIPKHVDPRLRALVIRNYPAVPFFDTFRQMVAEFPTDDGGGAPTPETDPEFWTRSI